MKFVNRHSAVLTLLLITVCTLLLAGCKSILPVRSVPVENQAPLFAAPTFSPTQVIAAGATAPPQGSATKTAACTNLFQYISDLTYPDGSEVKPGEAMDKQWKVKNAGTCNWDATYSLKLVQGDAMSALSPQALVPARNNTETVISIQFTAPEEPGRYVSMWRTYASNGEPFGDILYIDIIVVAQ